MLKKKNKDDVLSRVLKKANVSQIILKGKKHKIIFCSSDESNIINDESIRGKLLFDADFNHTNLKFSNGEFIELLDEYSLKVSQYILEKNYIMATIHMANYDYIYRIVSREESIKTKNSKVNIFKNHKLYNYRDKIEDFPISLREDLQNLSETLSFRDIYKNYYDFSIISKKNKGLAETRSGNGIAFSDEEYTARNRLYPIMLFMIGNEIIIDNYIETKELFETVLLESYEHYLSQGIFTTDMKDLFIFIKYCKNSELKILAKKLSENKKIIEISKVDSEYHIILRKYLINSLKNICESYKYKKNQFMVTSLDKWLENILVLMGFVKWNENEFDCIMRYIIPVCENGSVSISFYDNFQFFLGTNWKLYETAHPSVLRLVDVFLIKIISDRFNGYDHSIIDGHKLSNTFAVSSNSGIVYENISLVKQAILKIEGINKESQYEFIRGFFIYIRNIGTPEIKKIINDFIEINILKIKPSTPSDFSMILFLLCNDYEIPDGFIESLSEFIDENVPRIFSEDGYRNYRLESDLPDYLNFLINEQGMLKFTAILDKFNEKMDEVKK